jgi:hypothetical protein
MKHIRNFALLHILKKPLTVLLGAQTVTAREEKHNCLTAWT